MVCGSICCCKRFDYPASRSPLWLQNDFCNYHSEMVFQLRVSLGAALAMGHAVGHTAGTVARTLKNYFIGRGATQSTQFAQRKKPILQLHQQSR